MKKNIKAALGVSVLSGICLVGNVKANAMIKKAITGVTGAASKMVRSASSVTNGLLDGNSQGQGSEKIGSYSRYAALRRKTLQSKAVTDGLIKDIKNKQKTGVFKNGLGGTEVVKIFNDKNHEGIEYSYILLEDGLKFPVTTDDGVNYYPTLTSIEVKNISESHTNLVRTGIDKLGYAVPVLITDGDSGPIAYNLSEGNFRYVNMGNDGEVYLENKVNIDTLSPDLQNNAKKIIRSVGSIFGPTLDIEAPQGYVPLEPPKSKAFEKLSVELPILTSRQVKTLQGSNESTILKALDENGSEKSVIIVGGGDEKIAYLLTTGEFYKIGLNKRNKVKLENKVSQNSIDNSLLKGIKDITDNLVKNLNLTDEQKGQIATTSTPRSPISSSVNIPKLTESQIENIETMEPIKIQNLKDSNGVERKVFVIGDDSKGKVAYDPLKGSVNSLRTSKKGNLVIEKIISVDSLSEDLKNEVERFFGSLKEHTKLSDSLTEGSEIVGGARRKTSLVIKTKTGKKK